MISKTKEGWSIIGDDDSEWSYSALIRRYGRIDIEPLWSHPYRVPGVNYSHGTEKAAALKLLLSGLKSQNFIRPYLKPATAAIDVGAHLGTFSVPMMEALGPDGFLLAFEPDPDLAQCLRANCQKAHSEGKSAQFVIEQKAISDYPRNDTFRRMPGNWGAGHLILPQQADSLNGDHVQTVSVAKLDEFETSFGTRDLSLIKIDTEGRELEVIKGAINLISRYRPALFVEVNSWGFDVQGLKQANVEEALKALDYKVESFPEPWIKSGFSAHDLLATPL